MPAQKKKYKTNKNQSRPVIEINAIFKWNDYKHTKD